MKVLGVTKGVKFKRKARGGKRHQPGGPKIKVKKGFKRTKNHLDKGGGSIVGGRRRRRGRTPTKKAKKTGEGHLNGGKLTLGKKKEKRVPV